MNNQLLELVIEELEENGYTENEIKNLLEVAKVFTSVENVSKWYMSETGYKNLINEYNAKDYYNIELTNDIKKNYTEQQLQSIFNHSIHGSDLIQNLNHIEIDNYYIVFE